MLDLTFGEQVKIVLSRKGMTIKELAEIIEERTGKKMSRQNLTQRLGRDNFQEQDMRMIAEILGCPFQLSILADINEVERASRIGAVQPTETELGKLARAKERKEERKEKRIEKKAETTGTVKADEKTFVQRYIVAGRAKEEAEVAEREVTVGELVDIPEETVEVYEEPAGVYEEAVEVYEEVTPEEVYVEPMQEESLYDDTVEEVQEEQEYEEMSEMEEDLTYGDTAALQVEDDELEDLLNEIDKFEKERKSEVGNEERQPVQEKQEDRKNRGWRAMFQRRSKKEDSQLQAEEPVTDEVVEELVEEPVQEYLDEDVYEEEPVYFENDYIDYESNEEPEVEEEVQESEEEEIIGEINPYTGREYESNSVRMHPKRIGYVQVYDRSDHQWTDMTEWAFLGYQERKKALLGKDYEQPIYLD